MACLDRETATAYLRGDLEPDEAERWAAHLASCEACRQIVADVSALIDDVRQDLLMLDAAAQTVWPCAEDVIEPRRHQRSVTSTLAWLTPRTFAAALASAAVLTIVLWVRGTPVSAAEFLQRASAAEQVTDRKAGAVLFRIVTIEERRGVARTLVSRRRVETWRKTATALTARRAYDEAGRLVAAEWIDDAGARTAYTTGRPPARSDQPPLPSRALLRGETWRLDLSATAFTTLIDTPGAARATETANAVHITYTSSSADLTAVTLTLSKPDLHAVEETLHLGRGDDAQEFRIAEDRANRVASESVDARVFHVDAGLEPAVAAVPARQAASSPRVSETLLMGLEVEALRLLDGAGALLGEQVNVMRTPAGVVRVEATVDSDARKQELGRVLGPLAAHERVDVAIETFEAAARRNSRYRAPSSQPSQTAIVRAVEVEKDDIAVGPLLRDYFGARGTPESDAPVAERVRAFANQAVERSRLIVQHAWAIKKLASRYDLPAQRALDASSRAAWRTLIRQHAATVADQGSQLRQLLQPAFFPEETLSVSSPGAADDEPLGAAAERLLTLAHAQDEAVRTAFVTSASTSATTAFLQTQPFWNALTELVALAQRTAAE